MATAAAALIARARREVQHHFFSADAVRPDRAVDFVPMGGMQERMFERMRSKGIIKSSTHGRYWLDVVEYDRDVHDRLARLRMLALVLAGAFALSLIAGTTGLLS